MVLEKVGEDQMDRYCKKCRSIAQSKGGQEYPKYDKQKEG
jgi:hypothetical protein